VLWAESNVMNHTSQLIYSIAAALRGTAYHLVVMPYFDDQDAMDPIRYLVETESADGLILNQTQPQDPRIRYLADHHFPFATHGRTALGYDDQSFDYDNDAFARLAVAELQARGRHRILLIAPPRTHMYALHIIEGAIAAARERDLSLEIMDDVTSDSAAAEIEAAVTRRFGQSPRPDAMISGSTIGAMAATTGAEACGLVLGRDFDIVSKEAIPFLHRFRKEMIVVHEDVSRAGDALARAVIAAIEGRTLDEGLRLEVPTGVKPRPA
jgi:LacI family transcriptional regulator